MTQQVSLPPEVVREQKRLSLAYARVLGQLPVPGEPDTRTDDQKLVMADMELRGYYNRSTFQVLDGKACPMRLEAAEGQRMFLLTTHNLIRGARVSEQRPPVKAKK